MKLTKLLILFLFLSLKGFSQQVVLTSSGEKVNLNFLSSSGGTITGTLGVTGNTTISGTTTLTGINNTGTITNTGTLINNGKFIVGASSAASASAVLEASSTTQGFLPPRMTSAQRVAISAPVSGLVVWCSNCGSNGELQVYNGTTWTNMIGGAASAAPYTIGQAALGGKIAYILVSGDPGYMEGEQHGLVAATSDQSSGIMWNNGVNTWTTTGATGTAIGTGSSNTTTITGIQGAGSYAAKICADYTVTEGLVTYDDWYLPSNVELNKLLLNRVAIGNFKVTTIGVLRRAPASTRWSSIKTLPAVETNIIRTTQPVSAQLGLSNQITI